MLMRRVLTLLFALSCLSLPPLRAQEPACATVARLFPTRFVEVEGLRLAYRESLGRGPAIVFIHGNSDSKEVFQKVLLSPLGLMFRMVFLDLPGHGESSAAVDPMQTYTIAGLEKVLTGVVERLHLEKALFVGNSLGGHLLVEISPALPQAKGFLIFGTPPLDLPPAPDAFLPNPALFLGFTPQLTEAQAQVLSAAKLSPLATEVPAFLVEDVLRTDGWFRGLIGQAMGTGQYRNEVAILQNLKVPIAIFHGEKDQLVNGAYLQRLEIPTLWRRAVQTIPQAGHLPQWERPAHFNLLLAQFAFEVFFRR